MSVALDVANLRKAYGNTLVLMDMSLSIRPGELMAVLGASGSGKSTLLHIVAGTIMPSSGEVLLDGEDLVSVPIHKRRIGIVFQGYSLFPHLNVFDNVAFPLRTAINRIARNEINRRVSEILDIVELENYERRKPHELSGGQQQRVALARALVFGPRLLLLDEPLAALDRQLRDQMVNEIRTIQQRFAITTIYVTHDQNEAMTVADRIAVLQHGRIEQLGTPAELYETPVSEFIAGFVGDSNIVTGTVVASRGAYLSIKLNEHLIVEASRVDGVSEGDPVSLVLRPEGGLLVEDGLRPDGTILHAEVLRRTYLGSRVRLEVLLSGGVKWIVDLPSHSMGKIQTGANIRLCWPAPRISVMPTASTPDRKRGNNSLS